MIGMGKPLTTQTAEGGPDYLPLPKSVAMYTPPRLPEDPQLREAGQGWIERIATALETYNIDGPGQLIDLSEVTRDERRFLDEILKGGEVSALALGEPLVQIEETIFTGLWRIRGEAQAGLDMLEVADIPTLLRARAKAGPLTLPAAAAIPDYAVNAPHVLAELLARSAEYAATGRTHMINLDLVPMSDQELSWLVASLGEGPVVIISSGYGACRIRSTNLAGVWWVQYANASDALMLNSLEVTAVPAVACAAQDDIADSAARLRAVGGHYR